MTQLAIDFTTPTTPASEAVISVLSDGSPKRSLTILIALWHEYTWEDVKAAIDQLMTNGKISQVGTYQSDTPEVVAPIRDEIYRIGEAACNGWRSKTGSCAPR